MGDPEPPVVSGRYRATQSGIGRLTRGLLVIVGAKAEFTTETSELSNRGRTTGRLSVDAPAALR
jgi:hypothetical protein